MIGFLRRRRLLRARAADDSRRSFIRNLSAGATGALASTAALASGDAGDGKDLAGKDLAGKVASLEAEQTLRRLHQAFEQAMDNGRFEEVVDMFSADAEVTFNGGVFANRSQGVSRLYFGHFRPGKSGRRMEPAPGFEPDAAWQQDSVDVAADLLSAQAVFPYSIQVGQSIESNSSLVAMARLQGDGVRAWWEGGTYNVTYTRISVEGSWKISRLEYTTLSCADYRPGRSDARAVTVEKFSTLYPVDQHGPDSLV